MVRMTVWRDANHKLINIGPWEFNVQLVEARDADGNIIMDMASGEPYEHPDGTAVIDPETGEPHINPSTRTPLMVEYPMNLPPDGAYRDEADIAEDEYGGLYEDTTLAAPAGDTPDDNT